MNKLIKSILALSFVFVLSSVVLCAQENTELKLVSDVSVKFTDYGLKITSSDQDYLNSITSIRMVYSISDKGNDITFESSQWTVSEGEVFLPCSAYIEAGITRNVHQTITVIATSYSTYTNTSYLQFSKAADLKVTMNQNRDIVITSSDETWMKLLVETPKENVICFIDGSIERFQLDNTDLLFENGQVLIPYEVQLKYGIRPGMTYKVESAWVGGYYGWGDLGELTITHGRTDQNYEELIAPPEYAVEFGDYGLSITSEDENFLNNIDQILLIDDETITLSSESIISDENGRFVLCGEYLSLGVEVSNHYDIVVSAKGYLDSKRNKYLGHSYAKDVEVSVNEVGDIVITSPDLYWLKVMAETKNENAIDVKHNGYYLANSISNEEMIFEGTQIRIPSIVQKKHGMITNSTYLLSTGRVIKGYYYQDCGTVTLTHALVGKAPEDAEITQNEYGQIEITSSDKQWLQDILLAKTELGKSSLVVQTTGGGTIEFYNDENQTDLIYQDGKVLIDFEIVRERGLIPKEYSCCINSANYVQAYSSFTIDTYLNPTDVQIKVDSTSGDIIITSSDLIWLQSLVELRDKYAAIYVTGGSGNTHFWNTNQTTDLVLNENRVIITKDAQRRRGLVQGETVQFQFYSDLYGNSDLYEVTVGKGGCKKLPDDIQVVVEANGNIVIKSSDLNWLKSLTELHDDEYAAVYVTTDSGNAWFWNDSNETDLYFEGNRVVIKPEAQQRRGLYQNEIIQLYFFSYEYGPTKDFQIQIGTGGLKKVPDDLVLIQDQNGNVLIQTSDQEYLNTLLEGTVEFISEELGVKWFFYREDMKKGSEILISVELMKERGLINGEYDIELSASGYPKETFNGQLMNLKDRNPNQVNIVFDENEGIIISCQSSEYIQSITHVEMAPVNGNQAYIYDDTQGIREELRYVIPIEEMIKDGVNPDTYSIYVLSEMYGIESGTLELNSEVFKVNDVVRIKGQTRFETSLKIADALKETLELDKFDVVILANGRDFADALAGSVLAISQKAPILMVDSKNNNMTQIMDYLSENMKSDGKIYILGGEAAVPAWAEETLNNADIAYERIKGKNRYGTNLAILEKAEVNSEIILVCNGKSFADSLSASATGYPMLLVGSSLNDEQKAYLQKNTGKQYVILGGTGAVSSGIEEALKSYGTVERVYGTTRYETSIEIAKRFFRDSNKAVLAYAKNYPDGLCGGPLAYYMNAPLILTANGNYSAAQNYLNEKIVQRGAVLGGASLISNETVKELLLKLPVEK